MHFPQVPIEQYAESPFDLLHVVWGMNRMTVSHGFNFKHFLIYQFQYNPNKKKMIRFKYSLLLCFYTINGNQETKDSLNSRFKLFDTSSNSKTQTDTGWVAPLYNS